MERGILEGKLASYDDSVHDLIEELLEEYFTGETEDVGKAALALRRRRLVRKRDAMKERRRELHRSIQDIEGELQVLDNIVSDVDDEVFEDALEACSKLPKEKRVPENSAIVENAEKVGLTPEELVERLGDRNLDRFGNPIHESE